MPVDTLCKRIIPCLDVAGGTTVKGIKFGNLRSIGDPVELALAYQKQGADEITFLDISATAEQKTTVYDLVAKVADNLSIPFTVGGGISSMAAVARLLANGADKVSINSAAVQRPDLISEIAETCGTQCCVVAIDARRLELPDEKQPRWEVLVKGGRQPTGKDALEWASECVERGAGEILLTSWDQDGTLSGFDIELVKAFALTLRVPVIASGGARDPESFVDVFKRGHADAALAATIFHDGLYTVGDVKQELNRAGVTVRLC